MPQYDGQMRLADNLVRIQEERNELFARCDKIEECLRDFLRLYDTGDDGALVEMGFVAQEARALLNKQVPL